MEGTEGWRSEAACAGQAALWFNARKADRPHLRQVCRDCPVRKECKDHAKRVGQTEVFQAGHWWVGGKIHDEE